MNVGCRWQSMTPPGVRIRRAVLTSLALWCESRDLSYVGNFVVIALRARVKIAGEGEADDEADTPSGSSCQG
jgi:hypothetical protein